jgi:hypothetical protein
MKFKDLFEVRGSRPRTSDSYRFTHDPDDPDTTAQLAQLRADIKDHNKVNWHDPKRVSVVGRLGTDNPNAVKYRPSVPVETHETEHVNPSHQTNPVPANQFGDNWMSDSMKNTIKGLADAKAYGKHNVITSRHTMKDPHIVINHHGTHEFSYTDGNLGGSNAGKKITATIHSSQLKNPVMRQNPGDPDYQSIRMKDAKHYDVYVYNKPPDSPFRALGRLGRR